MGYDFSEDDGKWFDNEAEITDRLTLNLASKTLGELTESGFNFDSLLEGVTFGSLFNVAPSSSVIMQKLKDTEITKLEEKLNEMYLGDLLDFHRREINTAETVFEKITPNVGRISATGEYIRFDATVGKWFKAQDCKTDHGEHTDDCFDFQFYDEEENEAGGINNIISNLSVSNLETSDVITEIMALPLSEFFGTQQKGVLSLLDSDPLPVRASVCADTCGKQRHNGLLARKRSNRATMRRPARRYLSKRRRKLAGFEYHSLCRQSGAKAGGIDFRSGIK